MRITVITLTLFQETAALLQVIAQWFIGLAKKGPSGNFSNITQEACFASNGQYCADFVALSNSEIIGSVRCQMNNPGAISIRNI